MVAFARPVPCLAASGATVVGLRLSAGPEWLDMARLTTACVTVTAITAAVNTINDVCDARSDAISNPTRPLPNGDVTRAYALSTSLIYVLLGMVAATRLGSVALTWATTLLVCGILYCVRLKNTVLAGNFTVACLAASPILFGSAIAGGVSARSFFAALLLAAFMYGYEILKTVRDQEGDNYGGLSTVATVLGNTRSRSLFRGSGWLFMLLTALSIVYRPGFLYWVVLIAGSATPVFIATVKSYFDVTNNDTRTTIRILTFAWWPGLIALGMLG
nr:UbiA family prenyltransferase [Nocardia wallacei]